jgi:GT2 family glycosyltransferase
MMDQPLVSVVIINFNSNDFIWRCLEALKNQTYKNIEIFVIDNASDDGSSEKLQNINDKRFNYHRFEKNVGSSVANNYGIKHSIGEYILILNADVFLTESYIEKTMNAFKKNELIGTVTGKLLSEANKKIIDTTGIILFKEGVGHERGMGEEDTGQYDFEDYVVGACCAAAMYKRKMLEDIRYKDEYYDEDYFAFVEDLDLSVCSILMGWKTLYTYEAVGYHVRGGSTSSMSDFVKFLNLRNSEMLYYKYFQRVYSIRILHFFLSVMRIIKLSSHLRKEIIKDILEKKSDLKEKQLYFKNKINKQFILPYLQKSYILHRLFTLK